MKKIPAERTALMGAFQRPVELCLSLAGLNSADQLSRTRTEAAGLRSSPDAGPLSLSATQPLHSCRGVSPLTWPRLARWLSSLSTPLTHLQLISAHLTAIHVRLQ